MEEILVNEFQTKIDEDFLNSMNQEVREQFLDAIENVPYIKNLISKDRKRAKDLDRDSKGRIIVDLCNPHILEDMDYFRETAIHYQKYGCLTNLRPNANPNSEFGRWIRRETDRIWNGMVRESDGEWITGQNYFYLNYSPMVQTKIIPGTNIADRVVDMPISWEGVYLWFHYIEQARYGGVYDGFTGGKHCMEIAKRGASKSYTCASILARLFVCGDNEISKEKVRGVISAYDKEKLIKDGTLNKFVDVIDFCAEHTQYPSLRLKNSIEKMQWKMGYQDLNTGTEKGTQNEIMGNAASEKAGKNRGKRSRVFIYEEIGEWLGFIDSWAINKRSVQEGDVAFGQAIAIGTAGTKKSIFAGVEEMIYNPIGYDIYALPNIYDRELSGGKNTIYFFPAYLNRLPHYNKDGVSDVVISLKEILINRYNMKYNSEDPDQLQRVIAEDPITLQEVLLSGETTIYPINDILGRLNEIDNNQDILNSNHIGLLDVSPTDGIVYKPTTENLPIRMFPHKNNKLKGGIEIFEMPKIDPSTKKPFSNRYIAGIDPYENDTADTLSLGSIFILDLWTDEIVFEYTGRPQFVDDFHEICRRALLFYDARANYENNKKGLFGYFSTHNCLYLLVDNLKYLKDMDIVKTAGYGNTIKGTRATEPIKSYGKMLYNNWLRKPIETTKMLPDQTIETTTKMNLWHIKSRALLKETQTWNSKNNYDRHDAMVFLMLLREDRLIMCSGKDPRENANTNNKDYLGNDDFFSKNYKKKKDEATLSY